MALGGGGTISAFSGDITKATYLRQIMKILILFRLDENIFQEKNNAYLTDGA